MGVKRSDKLTAILIIKAGVLKNMYKKYETKEEAERAAEMSGPSKFLVNLIVKISRAFTKITPLHDKFKIDDTGVAEEIAELMVLRSKHHGAAQPHA